MKLLLDTHVALWALVGDRRLNPAATKLIADPDNWVFVSAVSVWEIAIKHALGRSGIPFPATEALRYFEEAGYSFLSISPEHAATVEQLPLIHDDPFDRMLVAQSIAEPLRLMTHDATVARYSDTVIAI